MTAEILGIDSENYLFSQLWYHKVNMPNLISRRQFNDRRKQTSSLCGIILKRIVNSIDGGETYFCIESKPIEVCRIARGNRCKMRKTDYEKALSFGYCSSQKLVIIGINYMLKMD